ncbi:DUF5916 domain-containing protein [Pontibacter sp. G13]|uniref:DUF5916 domain-containing protein n=1 Tax=Pontibacter sp. G13 TaxID=3074898 RepID=UPI00288A4E44|nr:DUF5916 domain-containing protein [Pontibacter sp. G13]WNJ19852.1 DUF5916 domain-containing protein [Pontibacter sp. G13]
MRLRFTCLLWVIMLCAPLALHAQLQTTTAHRIQDPPKIDGILDEEVWSSHPNHISTYFIETAPNNGVASEFKSEVTVLYDDEALYIGAKLHDPNPELIAKELGQRDDGDRNVDDFGICIDPFLTEQNAFIFIVTAAGVQIDMFHSDGDEDANWNAVWESDISFSEEGWFVEIEIPYMAIRFPKKDVQTWGINFGRKIQRKNDLAFWNFVDANVNGFANQFGRISGLENIKPPLRLSATPFLSGYLNRNPDENWNPAWAAGMDLKYGINESFTLDVSLVPDFGQVRSDNQVLNLGPFEVFYEENRPFFTEGTELFNKGNVFYSRRVGSSFGVLESPEEGEEIISRPNTAPLINATKLSGRTANGLGIGLFNAVTNRSYATVEDSAGNTRQIVADPLTNFNVAVLDQNLPNNSNVALVNTNVSRAMGGRNANVTLGQLSLFDKTNTWNIFARTAVSQIYERNDEDEVELDLGYAYRVSLAKVSGRFQFGVSRNVETDNYNPNDLGFLNAPNEITHAANVSFQENSPFWKLNNFRVNITAENTQTFLPREFDNFSVRLNINAQTKGFWNFGGGINARPKTNVNHFEPRTDGYVFNQPRNMAVFGWFGTDTRKPFQININGGYWSRPSWNQHDYWMGFWPRWRINNRLTIAHGLDINRRVREIGFVDKTTHESGELDEVIMGRRNLRNMLNQFTASYTFTPLLGMSVRVRHNWTQVNYTEYFGLAPTGELLETGYTGIDDDGSSENNTNFNAFTVDWVANWQFAPGSTMSLVWKYQVNHEEDYGNYNYWDNIQRIDQWPSQNSISLRVLYFLDYLDLKRWVSPKA